MSKSKYDQDLQQAIPQKDWKRVIEICDEYELDVSSNQWTTSDWKLGACKKAQILLLNSASVFLVQTHFIRNNLIIFDSFLLIIVCNKSIN